MRVGVFLIVVLALYLSVVEAKNPVCTKDGQWVTRPRQSGYARIFQRKLYKLRHPHMCLYKKDGDNIELLLCAEKRTASDFDRVKSYTCRLKTDESVAAPMLYNQLPVMMVQHPIAQIVAPTSRWHQEVRTLCTGFTIALEKMQPKSIDAMHTLSIAALGCFANKEDHESTINSGAAQLVTWALDAAGLTVMKLALEAVQIVAGMIPRSQDKDLVTFFVLFNSLMSLNEKGVITIPPNADHSETRTAHARSLTTQVFAQVRLTITGVSPSGVGSDKFITMFPSMTATEPVLTMAGGLLTNPPFHYYVWVAGDGKLCAEPWDDTWDDEKDGGARVCFTVYQRGSFKIDFAGKTYTVSYDADERGVDRRRYNAVYLGFQPVL